MKLGIVGLPNSGKSTLFNAIMQAGAEAGNYPFSTVSPNVSQVPVPDERLQKLTEMYNPKKTTPATVEMVDIAGLVKGASKGEGLGNQFLSFIREVDALIHVVRCFEDENVAHVYDTIDPVRDIETVNFELILADLEIVERRLSKIEKLAQQDKSLKKHVDILNKLKETFENGEGARTLEWDDPEDAKFVKGLTLISQKPVLYVANVTEGQYEIDETLKPMAEYVTQEGMKFYTSCAKLEAELSILEPDEKLVFMEELGMNESGLTKLITSGYELLGLISFFTTGPKEVRAWTIRLGAKAPEAAGKIHSDLERGFIRAEVVAYNDIMTLGGYNQAKEKGLVRVEGKEYIVKDGDIMVIRFNV